MEQKIKNYLGIVSIVAVVAGAIGILSLASSFSRSVEPSSFRSFTVSGKGEIVTVPDIAETSFSVIIEGGTNVSEVQKSNTEKMNSIIDFIKDQGVKSKDIKTSNYNLSPRYQYHNCSSFSSKPCPPREIVGYTINQTVSLKIRDFDKIGNILTGAVENGANSISGISFSVDNPEELQNEALEKAFDAAREKAKITAKAGGFKVGRLLSFNENSYRAPTFYEKGGAYGIDFDETSSVPEIEPGSQEISVTVNLTFEIK